MLLSLIRHLPAKGRTYFRPLSLSNTPRWVAHHLTSSSPKRGVDPSSGIACSISTHAIPPGLIFPDDVDRVIFGDDNGSKS